jgi:hypothetical protein
MSMERTPLSIRRGFRERSDRPAPRDGITGEGSAAAGFPSDEALCVCTPGFFAARGTPSPRRRGFRERSGRPAEGSAIVESFPTPFDTDELDSMMNELDDCVR